MLLMLLQSLYQCVVHPLVVYRHPICCQDSLHASWTPTKTSWTALTMNLEFFFMRLWWRCRAKAWAQLLPELEKVTLLDKSSPFRWTKFAVRSWLRSKSQRLGQIDFASLRREVVLIGSAYWLRKWEVWILLVCRDIHSVLECCWQWNARFNLLADDKSGNTDDP